MIKYLLYVLNITISFAFCCKKEGVDKGCCCCCKSGDSSKKPAGSPKTKSISEEGERRINDTNLSSQANNVNDNGLLNPFNNVKIGNEDIHVPPIKNNLNTFNNNNNLNNNISNNNNLNTNNNSNNNNNLSNNISNNRPYKIDSPFNGDTRKILDNKMNNNNSYNNNNNNNFYMNNNINNYTDNNWNKNMNNNMTNMNNNINNYNNYNMFNMNNNLNFYNNNNKMNYHINNNMTNMNSNMINMNNNMNWNMNNNFNGNNFNVNKMNINNRITNNNNFNGVNNLINNMNINNNYNNNRIQPLSGYTAPTLIGLRNLGATCYINAVLQCLSQTKRLANYFLDDNNKIDKKNKLASAFRHLIKSLWNRSPSQRTEDGYPEFVPADFINIVKEMGGHMEGQAGDSFSFLQFIIETLHKELKKSTNHNIQPLCIPDQYSQQSMSSAFLNDYYAKNYSEISDIFYGVYECKTECFKCKQENRMYTAFSYELFYYIDFKLEVIKCNNNQFSLSDGFKNNQATNSSNYYCNSCNQICAGSNSKKIYISPKVLILVLDRGKGNNHKIKTDLPMKLDISQFVQVKNGAQIYNLYGIITHIGESGAGGHYNALCKSPINGEWYRYNDSYVTVANDNDFYNLGTHYIYFYERA